MPAIVPYECRECEHLVPGEPLGCNAGALRPTGCLAALISPHGEVPDRAPSASAPLVSVIIANRNDLAMLLVTVLSAVEALRPLGGASAAEIVVVDNSDPEYSRCVEALLAGQIKDRIVRLVRQEEPSGAAAMELAASEARGRYLYYVDSHSLIGSGAIESAVNFLERHSLDPIAFVHQHIQWAHMSSSARKCAMRLYQNSLGTWGRQLTSEQRVTWKGMPHAIRSDVYRAIGGYGCLAEHRVGWGGLIPYLGMKPWLLGYENWGIPEGVAYHFGEYPDKCRSYVKYRVYTAHGRYSAGWSHAVAAYVMGGEDFLREQYEQAGLKRWFKGGLGEAMRHAQAIGSKERAWIESHQVITIQELLANPPWGRDF